MSIQTRQNINITYTKPHYRYQLRHIRTVLHSLTPSAIQTLVHIFVGTRVDVGNSLLYGTSAYLLECLQSVLKNILLHVSGAGSVALAVTLAAAPWRRWLRWRRRCQQCKLLSAHQFCQFSVEFGGGVGSDGREPLAAAPTAPLALSAERQICQCSAASVAASAVWVVSMSASVSAVSASLLTASARHILNFGGSNGM